MSISYGKAIEHFSKTSYPVRAREVVEQFRELKERGMLRDDERDISVWMQRGFKALVTLVQVASARVSKRDIKRAAKSESIKLIDTPTIKLVIPLSIEAATLYGKGTVWCTTSRDVTSNRFITFFYCGKASSVILYWINTETNARIGIQYDICGRLHFYDAFNNVVSDGDFFKLTGITESQIRWYVKQHRETIDLARYIPPTDQEAVGACIGENSVYWLARNVEYYNEHLDALVNRVQHATTNADFATALVGIKHDYKIMRNTVDNMLKNSKLDYYDNLTIAHPIMAEIVESSEAYTKLRLMDTRLEDLNSEIQYLDAEVMPSYTSLMHDDYYPLGSNDGYRLTVTRVQRLPDAALNINISIYQELVQQIRQNINANINRLFSDSLISTAGADAVSRMITVYRPTSLIRDGP